MMEREEKNRLILAELARLYPDAKPALHFANPFQLLVAVVLSAQCTDVKVNMVTPALFAAYPDAAALAKAEPEEIEPYIKTCGLRPPALWPQSAKPQSFAHADDF